MKIVALDQSLTCTGYAHTTPSGGEKVGSFKAKGLNGATRLAYYKGVVDDLLRQVDPDVVVMEGYAMGISAKGGRSFDLGELGGVLKLLIHESGYRTLVVPPSSLKMFATGKGTADKDQMRVAAGKLFGAFFVSDDEADAYHLLQMGRAFLEPRFRPRDRRHYKHAALRGCEVIGLDGARVSVETVFNGP